MATEMTKRVGAAILLAEMEWTPKSPLSKEETMARAAIEAMREPTDAMEDHAFATVRADSDNMQCPEFYRAMVDAALKPL